MIRTVVVARKSWTCRDCRRVISPGETYARWVALPDDDLMPTWRTDRCCAECDRRLGGDIPVTRGWPPAITRPDGRVYQPRVLRAEPWRNYWPTRARDACGAIVLGTHDIEVSRTLAEQLIRSEFDDDLRPVEPVRGWYRLVPRGYDDWLWDHDPVRGAAGVSWSADYPEEST